MAPCRAGFLALSVLAASHLAAEPALAQSGGVWIAGGLAINGGARVVTDFEPPRLFGLDGSGRATQTVDAGRHTQPLVEAGAQWFPAKHFGLEVWVARDRGEQQATGSSYDTTLTYIARQPPDFVARQFTYDRSEDWPPVRVELRRWTVGANVAVRPVASPRVAWAVSGGLARVRVSGVIEPLGFTTFVLGGRSVLIPNEYRLTTRLDPSWVWRANAGTTLDVRLASHVALTMGARFVFGADQDVRLRVASVDASQSGFSPPEDAEIDAILATSSARVETRSIHVIAGLKVLF